MLKMVKAVIYARYSSDKQDEASIDAQVRACTEYAQANGYAITKIYTDEAISGKGAKTASRKAYQQMLKDAHKQFFDLVLIHKLPTEVISDIGEKIVILKNEIKNLEIAEPPKDFTAEQITNWLNVFRSAADDKVVHLLINRIDANKTEINIQSTLNSVLGNTGRGDRI